MTSKERMKSWEDLKSGADHPKPSWEAWKRILAQNKFDPVKAKAHWEKLLEKKKELDGILFKV